MISFSFINFVNGIISSLHPIAGSRMAQHLESIFQEPWRRKGGGNANANACCPFRSVGKKLIFLMQHYLRNEVSVEIAK